MFLFPSEEASEDVETNPQSQRTPLMERLLIKGAKKAEEPLHRTKRLRTWPTEAIRKEIYEECLAQELGLPGDKETLERWRLEKAEDIWKLFTESLPQAEKDRVIYEYAMSYIAQVIANTIHLEAMYTALKPIGQKQWEISSKGLQALTQEDALSTLTERPELFSAKGKKKELPEWIKGAIIYLSLQSSRAGSDVLNPDSTTLPDMAALRNAAIWCLGAHLTIGGEPQSLESTSEIFSGWQKKRAEFDLQLVRISVGEIPEETPVPPTKSSQGKTLPWNLSWRILPITEKEIRELGEKVLNNQSYLDALGLLYKKQLLDRWAVGVTRRGYLRKFEETQGVSARWRTKTLVLNPLDIYVNSRIEDPNPVRLTAKTEVAWTMLTEDLPEPEIV